MTIDLRPYFGRTWTFERTIADRAAGRTYRAWGAARFIGESDDRRSMRYREAARVAFEARVLRATRSYRYRFAVDGTIAATFEDGAPFFTARFERGAAALEHRCGGDRYRGEMRILGPDRWEVRWCIDGTKDLEITTRYRVAARSAHDDELLIVDPREDLRISGEPVVIGG